MLKKFHPLFVSVHSNHPRELTVEVRDALGRLADAGIPLGNQSVLLSHVNDNAEVMKAHIQKLLMCRVRSLLPLSMRSDYRIGSFTSQRSEGLGNYGKIAWPYYRLRGAAVCH